MVIDAHNHFWKYHPVKHNWITDEMTVLKQDYLQQHLHTILKANHIDGCIAVQADESEEENYFLLKLAEEYDGIKGIVGWIDMMQENIEHSMLHYSQFSKMKGFRYILQGKAIKDLMLHPVFKRNIAKLQKHGFTYDILISNEQMKYAVELVKDFPNQKFIIDHLAKPDIKLRELNNWTNDITAIAKNENVWCKLSGMVTEADWKNHNYNDFVPYIETVLETFGTKRLLYGSDWPVCLLAAEYNAVFEMSRRFISSLSKDEQNDIMGNNAAKFYNL